MVVNVGKLFFKLLNFCSLQISPIHIAGSRETAIKQFIPYNNESIVKKYNYTSR